MRTAVFVQVRLGSTRLPCKALLRLPGGSIIQHVMRALAPVPADFRALLTDAGSVDALLPPATAEGFAVIAGPAEDVLSRFCGACRLHGIHRVVRATGDNPLASPELARSIMSIHESGKADLSHYLGNPWGTGVEIVEAAALFEAESESLSAEEREHVTKWLYGRRERFTILEPQAPEAALLPSGRVTVDTEKDYARVTRIFDALYRGAPIEVGQLVRWLRAHPVESPDA